METNKWRWHNLLIIMLNILSVGIWIYFLIQSIQNNSSLWNKIFWLFMECLSLYGLYRDRHLFINSKKNS
jgi:hypothetical protein